MEIILDSKLGNLTLSGKIKTNKLKVIKDITVSKNNSSNTGDYLFEQSRSLMEIVCVIKLIVSFVRLDYSSSLQLDVAGSPTRTGGGV